jgi:hypothetical protein
MALLKHPSKMTDTTKNTIQCCHCDDKIEYEDIEEVDDAGWKLTCYYGSVCNHCVNDEYYRPCDECGEWHHDLDLTNLEDPHTGELCDNELCDDCLETMEKLKKN